MLWLAAMHRPTCGHAEAPDDAAGIARALGDIARAKGRSRWQERIKRLVGDRNDEIRCLGRFHQSCRIALSAAGDDGGLAAPADLVLFQPSDHALQSDAAHRIGLG